MFWFISFQTFLLVWFAKCTPVMLGWFSNRTHLTTGKNAERTKLDFRCPICHSAIGQPSCLICACRRQISLLFISSCLFKFGILSLPYFAFFVLCFTYSSWSRETMKWYLRSSNHWCERLRWIWFTSLYCTRAIQTTSSPHFPSGIVQWEKRERL